MTQPAPAHKRNSFLFPLVVIVLVAVLAVEGFLLLRPKPTVANVPTEAQAAVAAGESQQVETFGDEAAPIKIEFYAPLVLPWHQETIGLLKDYDRAHPGTIFVTLMPMGQAECDAEIQSRGITCAVIFINGENEFELPDGRKVELYQRPNQSTSTYNSEDVVTVIDALVGKQSS